MDHFKNVGYVQYKEILLWIREAVPVRTPSNGRGVRKEIVWHNKDICTDRKTFIYKWLDGHGIKFVDDITDSRSYLLRYDCFLMRNQDVRIGQLRYMSLLSAIPTE